MSDSDQVVQQVRLADRVKQYFVSLDKSHLQDALVDMANEIETVKDAQALQAVELAEMKQELTELKSFIQG